MNISTILDMAAEAFGDRVGIVSGGKRLTYSELRNAALRASAIFKASGAKYVGLLDTTTPAAPIAIFGAAYAGIPYVPINYRLTREEINELVDRVKPVALVTGEHAKLVDAREGVTVLDRETLLKDTANGDVPEGTPDEDPASVAVQLFTSGTTGKPKAAILRHENLMSYIVGTVEFAVAAEEDAVLVTVPPYHIAGISAVLSSTYATRRMVQLDAFDPAQWLKLCREEGVSNAFLVPTMLARVVDHLESNGSKPDLPSLRAIAYGGGKMPLESIQKAMKLFQGVDFTNAYGLTETSSTITVLGPDAHREAASSADPRVQKRLASVGQATGAVEIAVRDDEGKPLAANEVGTIFVRGGQVSGEYLEKGSLLDGDGWFCTRDRGYLDDAGFLFLDGRADDVIVRGGENISPGEIEDVLLSHAAVADVAVVAIPDEEWGEAVAAAVVLKEGASAEASELQQLVKEKLRSSRVPKRILFKDALPYNETGKILRRLLKPELAAA